AGEETISAPHVISAVPWHALPAIWQEGCPPALSEVCAGAVQMASSPIVTVNLWFDQPVMTQRFVGLVDSRMHWIFDKRAIFGSSASHVAVVASGASDLAEMDNSGVEAVALEDLGRALPRAKQARLLRSIVVREHRATFSLAPGQPSRPGVSTAIAGFFL